MPRSRIRSAAVAALMLIAALPGVAGAGGRIPVESVDDPGQPLANRVTAVTNIVVATNARVARAGAAYPEPGPPTEPTALADAFVATRLAYEALGADIGAVCTGRPIAGVGAATISDADAYAADTSQAGVAHQLASVATVLGNADRRLGLVYPPNPIYPNPDPQQLAALATLYDAVVGGDGALSDWFAVPPNPIYPPNPCVGADG